MRDIDIIVTRKDELVSDGFFLTSKSKNAYKLTFNFIVPWDTKELKLQAVFKAEYQHSVAIDLDEEMSCIIPDEVVAKPGILGIGIRGIKEKTEEELELDKNSTLSYYIIKNTPYMNVSVVRGSF